MAVDNVDLSDQTPFLVLGWHQGSRVEGGRYPLHPDMASALAEVAQEALDRVDELEMSEYSGATLLATGEEGLWVPTERLNDESALLELLRDPDELKTLRATDLADKSFSFFAIGFGATEAERIFFVKKKARHLRADTAILGILQGPLKPIQGTVISLERDVDFILLNEGVVVFEANAFEKYLRDPKDVGKDLDTALDKIKQKLPFTESTLSELRKLGRKKSMLRRRIRSISEADYFATLDAARIRREFRRLKESPSDYIKKGKLTFPPTKALYVFKVLDEAAWRGGFSDRLYTTSAKKAEP